MEKEIKKFPDDPNLERLVTFLKTKTSLVDDDHFVRVLALSTITKMATSTRNFYRQGLEGKRIATTFSLVLARSGHGKGFCQGLLDDFYAAYHINYREKCKEHVQEKIEELASKKIASNPDRWPTREDAIAEIKEQIHSLGETPTSFGSACTLAGIRQIFLKSAMTDTGSLNWMVDEMASNYSKLSETFSVMLELWDGELKSNLIKNMDGQKRLHHCPTYRVPTTMLLMGSPTRLFDGGANEKDFTSQLETGMSRRMLMAVAKGKVKPLSIEEQYELETSEELAKEQREIRQYFASLSGAEHNKVFSFEKEALMLLYRYKTYCTKCLENLIEDVHVIERAEILERKDKASRVATILAFYGKQSTVSLANVQAAIKIVEQSGEDSLKVIYREPVEARLCKYLVAKNQLCTYPVISSELKLFSAASSKAKKEELVENAEAWGIENGIVLERVETGKVKSLRATELVLTDPSRITISATKDIKMTDNYTNLKMPFNHLHTMLEKASAITAHLIAKSDHGYKRHLSCMREGFQLLILDVDKGNLKYDVLHQWLCEYTYFIHETPSSTKDNRRYRIIIPMKYHLSLDLEKYKTFYKNLVEDFNVFSSNCIDVSVCDMARAWYTPSVLKDGRTPEFWYNRATPSKWSPFDTSPYLEHTFKREQMMDSRKRNFKEPSNLLQWLHENALEGKHLGRNNTLIRMLAVLHESGMDPEDVRNRILKENKKFSEPLHEEEVLRILNGSFNKKFE